MMLAHLRLMRGSGKLNIGKSVDPVDLNIEIYSNDVDKLVLKNLDAALDLDNINLNFDILKVSDPYKTNTIISLQSCNGFTGEFNKITWTAGFDGRVFTEEDDVKITGVVPEPVTLCFFICYLLAFRKFRKSSN